MNDTYWQGRKDLQYYRTVREFAEKYCPAGKTLLDVGGGVGLGCRYLNKSTTKSERGLVSHEKQVWP